MPYHNFAINVRDDQRDMEEVIIDKLNKYKANHKHIKTQFDALVELVMKGEAAQEDEE